VRLAPRARAHPYRALIALGGSTRLRSPPAFAGSRLAIRRASSSYRITAGESWTSRWRPGTGPAGMASC